MVESMLSVKDVAESLRVTTFQVRKMQAQEKLPAAVYIGRLPRWRESEISAWMQAGCPDRERWEAMQAARGV